MATLFEELELSEWYRGFFFDVILWVYILMQRYAFLDRDLTLQTLLEVYILKAHRLHARLNRLVHILFCTLTIDQGPMQLEIE